jgi:ribonucleotide monophosphatase NagD (HAD superfamily)
MPLPERVSGFLIDLDGTIVEGGGLVPGALAALSALMQRGLPFRIVTNTSEFFTLACQNMGVPLAATVVVGDDLEADVGGAKFAGCVGVLVRTGKFRPDQIKTSEIRPDAMLDSLADLPSLMG